MGTGIKNGRFNYSEKKLRTKYDWQKYIYTYKVWGRCVYNYETDDDNYGRYFRKKFGKASGDLIHSLSYSSKILPFFTLIHGVSASNNSYWPEMYENMSIVRKAPNLPYSYDLHKPSRFGMSTSHDPNLIMSPIELADCIYNKKTINRYSPITMSNWLMVYSKKSEFYLNKGKKIFNNKNDFDFKRLEIDINILIGLGKFFSYKIKSACYWELFLKEHKYNLGLHALKFYKKSYNEWSIISGISKKFYLPDLTYGPQSWLRGRWDDRLPAIKEDIDTMSKILDKFKFKKINQDISEKYLKWKNNQRFKITHKVKKQINGLLIIISKYKKQKNSKLYINFRQVNQSKTWVRKIINIKERKIISSIISNKLIKEDYPIQYYFELVVRNYSSFCPGLNTKISNQPYYIYDNL